MLLFGDSFDHYTTALEKWSATNGGFSFGNSNGRFSTGAFTTGGGDNGVRKTLPSSYATLILGFAYKHSAVGATGPLAGFLDSGTGQFSVWKSALDRLEVRRGGTLVATGTTVLASSVFYYIELKVTFHDTTGAYELRINEATELSATNVNTRSTANNTADQVGLGRIATSSGVDGPNVSHYDDFVVLDTTGSIANNFIGDIRAEAIFPNGNGNSSQFDGSDGNSTDNYQLVDETPPNGDTDYVESPDIGDKDTYAMGNVTPTTGTVYGIQVMPYNRKTDAGTRKICTVIRHSGTEEDSADFTLSSSYQYFLNMRETKPGGGSFSISDVNGMEAGVKVTA